MSINVKGKHGSDQARRAQRMGEQQVDQAAGQAGRTAPGKTPAGSSVAEPAGALDHRRGTTSGEAFKAAQAPLAGGQPKGMHGFLAAQQVGKPLLSGAEDMEIQRNGRMWANSFWADGQGVYTPAARLDFDKSGEVRGWMLDPSLDPPARVPFAGKLAEGALWTDANPAPLEITTAGGEIVAGKVSVYQDGSIDVRLDNGMTLGTTPDLAQGEGPAMDLVKGPLYGENPGGAYGHPSRLEFDLDGTVRGWVLDYSEQEDIHRDAFKGTWQMDGDKLSVTFTDDGAQKTLTGTMTADGVTLGDGQDKRFVLGRVKDLEDFFDA